MASFQRIQIIGNIGRDAEMRYTPSGAAVASFSVAVNRNFQKDGEWESETTWFNVTAWAELAERIADFDGYGGAKKGRSVLVEGRMQEPRIWEGKDGTPRCNLEITASLIRMLEKDPDAKPDNGEFKSPAKPAAATPSTEAAYDDLPF